MATELTEFVVHHTVQDGAEIGRVTVNQLSKGKENKVTVVKNHPFSELQWHVYCSHLRTM